MLYMWELLKIFEQQGLGKIGLEKLIKSHFALYDRFLTLKDLEFSISTIYFREIFRVHGFYQNFGRGTNSSFLCCV